MRLVWIGIEKNGLSERERSCFFVMLRWMIESEDVNRTQYNPLYIPFPEHVPPTLYPVNLLRKNQTPANAYPPSLAISMSEIFVNTPWSLSSFNPAVRRNTMQLLTTALGSGTDQLYSVLRSTYVRRHIPNEQWRSRSRSGTLRHWVWGLGDMAINDPRRSSPGGPGEGGLWHRKSTT